MLVGLAVLVVVLLAAFSSSPSRLHSATPAGSSRLLPAGPPRGHRLLALQDNVQLELPIQAARVTAIGYHPAGGSALALTPQGPQVNEGLFARFFHRVFGGGKHGLPWYQLGGSGGGPATGAVDVGARIGTAVYTPAAGTVISIRGTVIDGKRYGDVIRIQPSGSPTEAPAVVVSVSHLRADPSLTVGALVTPGVTKLGWVIDFSRVEQQALSKYTQDAGNHVTIDVESATSSGLS